MQAVVTAPTPTDPAADSGARSSLGVASPGQQLPDGVPLPEGALLVSGPTAVKDRGQVTGWAAVATQSPDSTSADARSFFRAQLALLGWSLNEPPADHSGWSVAAQRQVMLGSEQVEQWLQVSVTEPLSSSGPAISYRFVASPVAPGQASAEPAPRPVPVPSPSTALGRHR